MFTRRIRIVVPVSSITRCGFRPCSQSTQPSLDEEEFRVLKTVHPPKGTDRTARPKPDWKKNVPPARTLRMSTDQDWKSVWPVARSFHPAVVPLPIHMGIHDPSPEKHAAPDKWANTELMKIPNFLHLTPPAIKAHCRVLKKFCTPWPKELVDDETCWKYFPFEYIFSDYCHASPTIRDTRARVVKCQFKLSVLPLDYRSRDKLIRLLNVREKRYDKENDMVTIVADRCPLKMQNYDYINYLLTACYFEAWKHEDWESGKEMTDWERFYYEKSPSFKGLLNYLSRVEEGTSLPDPETMLKRKEVKAHEEAVSKLFDEPESEESVDEYKRSVLNLVFDGKHSDNNKRASDSETGEKDDRVEGKLSGSGE